MKKSSNQHDDFCGITITLKGTPRPQPRPRFVGGRVVSTASPKSRAFARALERAAREAVENFGGADAVREAFAGPGLSLWLLASFNTKDVSRHGKPHTGRVDGDNIAKLASDCLMRAGALGGDDSRIVEWNVRKVWGASGFLSVTVRPINTTSQPTRPTAMDLPPDWLRGR